MVSIQGVGTRKEHAECATRGGQMFTPFLSTPSSLCFRSRSKSARSYCMPVAGPRAVSPVSMPGAFPPPERALFGGRIHYRQGFITLFAPSRLLSVIVTTGFLVSSNISSLPPSIRVSKNYKFFRPLSFVVHHLEGQHRRAICRTGHAPCICRHISAHNLFEREVSELLARPSHAWMPRLLRPS